MAVLLLLCTGQLVHAQDHQTIKGVITDARNKEPLSGATIRLEGTTFATTTDQAGAYTLNAAIKDGKYSLTITFTGYKPITRTVTLDHSVQTFSTIMNENAVRIWLKPHSAGYMVEYGVERVWRDMRLNRIGAGTDEIMLDVIGRSYGL